MNNLIILTAEKLHLETGRVIYLAYEYAENIPHSKRRQRAIVRTIMADGIPSIVEDYCLDVLSNRASLPATPTKRE